MSTFEVIVYTSTGCPYCEKVKTQLKEWGIEYEERNVSLHKDYFDQLRAKKVFGTPATYVDGKLILGFQEKKFKKAFGIEDELKSTISEESAQKEEYTIEDEVFEKADKDVLDRTYDIVIIGGGPAGASAAVYAANSKLSTLVIDKASKARTLALTHEVANYPGVREEITGLELLTRIQIQAKGFGAKFLRSSVVSVNFSTDVKEIKIPEGVVKAKAVFISALHSEGMKPGTDFLNDIVTRDEEGYLVVDEHLRTNVSGVFAGGDARKMAIKQAVISAADGAIAALGADQFINQREKL